MTTNQNLPQPTSSPLFPPNLRNAPIEFWRQNRLAALVFLVVNLLFGTVGLWLPPLNAFFSSQSVFGEILKQLDAGVLYIYAITFLSAIGGVTFNSIASEKVDHSRNMKVVLAGSVVVALFACTILLQTQLFVNVHTTDTSSLVRWSGYVLQILIGIMTTVVAIYVYSIVSNEESGSAKDDMDRGANELLEKSKGLPGDTAGAWKS